MQLRSDYAEAIERLNGFIRKAVVVAGEDEQEERPFLPTIERIPAGERKSFAEALARTTLRKRLPELENALSQIA
jgi:hypothetical protein